MTQSQRFIGCLMRRIFQVTLLLSLRAFLTGFQLPCPIGFSLYASEFMHWFSACYWHFIDLLSDNCDYKSDVDELKRFYVEFYQSFVGVC